MTQYWIIKPEVAGGLGEDTAMDTSVHPPKVNVLHYEFDGWLGDDILESFPCFIVSERLKKKLFSENVSGIKFDKVKITTSEKFIELYPQRELPEFYWMKVSGKELADDVWLNNKNILVVSDRTLKILKSFNFNHCDVHNSE